MDELAKLRIEQRRVSDEYRVSEKRLQLSEAQLTARGLEPADRIKLETVVKDTRVELARMWNEMLEIDAAVTASAFRSDEL
jgi:hypothetical protein